MALVTDKLDDPRLWKVIGVASDEKFDDSSRILDRRPRHGSRLFSPSRDCIISSSRAELLVRSAVQRISLTVCKANHCHLYRST